MKENTELTDRVITLKEHWNAALDRFIDLDSQLLHIKSVVRVDVGCQTESFAPSVVLEPVVSVNRSSQALSSCCHLCYEKDDNIKYLELRCMELQISLDDSGLELERMSRKLQELQRLVTELNYSETFIIRPNTLYGNQRSFRQPDDRLTPLSLRLMG